VESNPIKGAVFTPDNRCLALDMNDGTTKLFELASVGARSTFGKAPPKLVDPKALAFRPITTLRDVLEPGPRIAISLDGKSLALASQNRVHLWEIATGRELAVFQGHTADVNAVAFAPDGKTLASASADKTARIWTVPDGNPIGSPLAHVEEVIRISFSPDGRLLLSAVGNNTAVVWEAISERRLSGLITSFNYKGYKPEFSPDSRRFVVCNAGVVEVHGTSNGCPLLHSYTNNGLVGHAQFSPDGQRLVSASEDRSACVWDVRSGVRVLPPLLQPAATREPPWALRP
jgi:WD40 repeat protein